MCARWMCTHISKMTIDGGAWLASHPGFFVSRNDPRYLRDKWFLPLRAALDIVALKCFIRKEEGHEENSNSSYTFLTSALGGGWVVSVNSRPRYAPGKEYPIPIRWVGFRLVWTQSLQEKYFASPGIEPRKSSLQSETVLTELSQLLLYSVTGYFVLNKASGVKNPPWYSEPSCQCTCRKKCQIHDFKYYSAYFKLISLPSEFCDSVTYLHCYKLARERNTMWNVSSLFARVYWTPSNETRIVTNANDYLFNWDFIHYLMDNLTSPSADLIMFRSWLIIIYIP
jgi:hypothetical protein